MGGVWGRLKGFTYAGAAVSESSSAAWRAMLLAISFRPAIWVRMPSRRFARRSVSRATTVRDRSASSAAFASSASARVRAVVSNCSASRRDRAMVRSADSSASVRILRACSVASATRRSDASAASRIWVVRFSVSAAICWCLSASSLACCSRSSASRARSAADSRWIAVRIFSASCSAPFFSVLDCDSAVSCSCSALRRAACNTSDASVSAVRRSSAASPSAVRRTLSASFSATVRMSSASRSPVARVAAASLAELVRSSSASRRASSSASDAWSWASRRICAARSPSPAYDGFALASS